VAMWFGQIESDSNFQVRNYPSKILTFRVIRAPDDGLPEGIRDIAKALDVPLERGPGFA